MFEPGFVIAGTYRIERLIAEGGMARLFLASHTRLPEKLFAIKVLIAQGASAATFALRFRREAEVMARLKHPHIVEISDWNETPEGAPYLVLEYLEGEDLAQLLRRVGYLSREDTLALVGPIASALALAHSMGVVHRDLKPGNIFLCQKGPYASVVKVLDFGIAKLVHDHGALKTSTQALIGTPAYMSPEQARGQSALITAQSDQFSLAIIIYELLTGRRPFGSDQDEVWAILSAIVTQEMPPLPPELAGLEAPLRRALRKLPEERYPTIEEFAAALGVAVTAMTEPPQRSSSRIVPLGPLTQQQISTTLGTQNGEVKPPRAKRTRLYALGALLTVLGAGVAASLLTQHRAAAVAPPAPAVGIRTAARPAPAVSLESAAAGSRPETSAAASAQPQAAVSALKESDRAAPESVSEAQAEGGLASPALLQSTPAYSAVSPAAAAAPAVNPTGSGAKRARAAATARPKRGEAGVRYADSAVHVTLTGATPPQAELIQRCVKEIYPLFEAGRTYEIKLARAGSLHLVQAPPQIHQSDLRFCLRTMFARSGIPIPAEVLIVAKRNR